MANDNHLNLEQLAEVENLLANNRNELVDAIQKRTLQVLESNQKALLESVEQRIVQAVEAHQKALITIAPNRVASRKEENQALDIFKVIFPVLLTGLLGWYVSSRMALLQTNLDEKSKDIQAKIDERSTGLSAQLALTQDYYKRKLTIYSVLNQKMANLEADWAPLQLRRPTKLSSQSGLDWYKQPSEADLADLSRTYTSHNLEISDPVLEQLQTLYTQGMNNLVHNRIDAVSNQAMMKQISVVDSVMKNDLQTAKLGTTKTLFEHGE